MYDVAKLRRMNDCLLMTGNDYSDVLLDAAKEIERLLNSLSFYQKRCQLLGHVQSRMRDPERTLVCDILANGTLLPDPTGERYEAGGK